MSAIRVGILGFAHGHVNAYCERWRKDPELGIEVVSGWDRDAARLAEACTKHGLKPAASAEALLAGKDVDAVVIASETAFHAELA
jgi:predicted dehydrogenase